MRILVVDDESIWRDIIKGNIISYLANIGLEARIDCCKDASFIERIKLYDLIYLDIELDDEVDGFELAEQINNSDFEGKVVFITSHTEWARDGYRVNAFRYVQKNNKEELEESIEAYLATKHTKTYITCKTKLGETKTVETDKIEYVESINRHIEYSLMNSIKLYGTGTLANVLEELENRGFCQVHRSYIVNFCNTKHIKRRGIMLSSGIIIPVGRTYYNEVKEKYAYWRLKNET